MQRHLVRRVSRCISFVLGMSLLMIPVQLSADSSQLPSERSSSSSAPEVGTTNSRFDAKYYSSLPDCDAARIQSFQEGVFAHAEHSQAELNFDFDASVLTEKITVNFKAKLAQNEMREVKLESEGLMKQSIEETPDEYFNIEAYIIPMPGENSGFDFYFRQAGEKSDDSDVTSGHNRITGAEYAQAMLVTDLFRLDLERLLKELPYKTEMSDTDDEQITILLPVQKLIDFGEAEYLRYEFDESRRDEVTEVCELARTWTKRFEEDSKISELVLPLSVRFRQDTSIQAIEFDWTELSPLVVEFLAKTLKAPSARLVRVKSFTFNLDLDHPTMPIEIRVPDELQRLKND